MIVKPLNLFYKAFELLIENYHKLSKIYLIWVEIQNTLIYYTPIFFDYFKKQLLSLPCNA
jgi:hypothetical protein